MAKANWRQLVGEVNDWLHKADINHVHGTSKINNKSFTTIRKLTPEEIGFERIIDRLCKAPISKKFRSKAPGGQGAFCFKDKDV